MRKKKEPIPINPMMNESGAGVVIEKISVADVRPLNKATANPYEEARQAHRHDGHSFFLLQSGAISIELDFQTHQIKSPAVIYIHPDQVHRILSSKNVTVSALTINTETLNSAYLAWLEDIVPAKPLVLKKETFILLSETISLCLKFAERKRDALYQSLLKDSGNALVALVLSLYAEQSGAAEKPSRFEAITKAFRRLLETAYTADKRPSSYARKLNLSSTYLNECVRNTTGYSVSHYIQQRVVLEAKRLLYHSGKSVKEIASHLGYDDYPYFSRLFTKVAGMSPLSFRNKNPGSSNTYLV